MDETHTAMREAAEDIYFGQVVLIWARWFVILATAILAFWSSDTAGKLSARIPILIILLGMNFFLHYRTLMDRPANSKVLIASSLIDLAVIGVIIATWQGHGLSSPYFVLLYPVLFAFALVFPPRLTAVYTLLALGAYLVICLLTGPSLVHAANAKMFVERLITLGAVAGLGAYYWRIQRARRREAIHRASGTRSLI
jgi:hypothetical protein